VRDLSIGFGELMVILCIAFFVVGPEDLPKVARTTARLVKKVRAFTREATEEFTKDLDLDTKELKDLQATKKDLQETKESLQKDIDSLKP